MEKILQFFNLEKSFTKNNLDNAYNKKIKELDQLQISVIDKEYYKETIKNLYYKAQHYINIFDGSYKNMFNISNNNFNTYSYYEVSSSKSNPDGSISVHKEFIKNKNGDIKKNVQSYIHHKDGSIKYLS